MTLRVLLTVPTLAPSFGGPALKVRALQSALMQRGHEVRVAGVTGQGNGSTVVSLKAIGRFHGTPIPWNLHRVAEVVRACDVVHVIGYRDPVGSTAALEARRRGVPYLLEPVGMHRRRLRSLKLKAVFDATLGRAVVNGARLLVATSSLEAQELAEDGVPADRIALRPNGLDVAQFDRLPGRGEFRAQLGIPDRAPVVLSVARIAAKKGLPALARTVSAIDGVHLVIAGPDGGDGTLSELYAITERHPHSRLHVMPNGLWGEEKLQAFADSDLFCLNSMTENFGIAAAEAACAGLATLVTDECGVAEWLGNGVERVSYGDVSALAESIRQLLRDDARRKALAERGRMAAQRLTWARIADEQIELYRRALAPA